MGVPARVVIRLLEFLDASFENRCTEGQIPRVRLTDRCFVLQVTAYFWIAIWYTAFCLDFAYLKYIVRSPHLLSCVFSPTEPSGHCTLPC